ncbi:hypothetical protein FIBSPDRAFT_964408 [Athelia psychrophila]|uniref:DUF6534 domain-containing protein n=1 Tax=Athelia psychrophila TaxID=1759441 RepID=A0A165XSW4_9AGAM|nr:hypothetical protein FIBSPDRAFT_964408 [Fibularhizoctonia sp. CBS 109695]
MYFKRHSEDGGVVKSIVAGILLLEALHFALLAHGAYFYLITCRTNYEDLFKPIWSLLIQSFPSTFIIVIVRYVFIARVWTLSQSPGKRIICIGMSVLAISEAGLTLTWTIAAFYKPFWGKAGGVVWPSMITFIIRAINDICLTSQFCVHLLRSKNGFVKTDKIIRTMIFHGLGSGFFACCGSICLILVLAILPHSAWYICVYIICTRVYANSLLGMLNSRRLPQSDQTTQSESKEMELTTLQQQLTAQSRWALDL